MRGILQFAKVPVTLGASIAVFVVGIQIGGSLGRSEALQAQASQICGYSCVTLERGIDACVHTGGITWCDSLSGGKCVTRLCDGG